jgi:hypothetical protein
MGLGAAIAVNGTPDADLALATSIEVHERLGETTTYTIRYDVDISDGDLLALVDSRLDPGSELSILVPVNQTNYCLVKGPVHSQQVHLVHGGAGSWVDVKGSDTSVVMDRETRSAVWADVADSDAVSSILGNYGYTPDVSTTPAQHLEAKHTLVQLESDLHFVRRLARRNGFLFWVTSDASGQETAHFKQPPVDDSAETEIIINLDSRNVDALDINWDVERPTSMEGKQLDLNSKSELDMAVSGPVQTVLGSQSLAAITGDTRSVHLSAPVDDTGDLMARGQGALIEAELFIHAACETSLATLGQLVRAHTVAEVKGAGSRYSGKYLVSGVRHVIDVEVHKMSIELISNGWNA